MKYIIPRFERTRVVKLVQMPDGTWVLVCSRLLKTRGHACRHVYKVLKRHPALSDANVRWQNGYGQHYGRNDELTDAFMDLCSRKLHWSHDKSFQPLSTSILEILQQLNSD
jgi:hypothetical protein